MRERILMQRVVGWFITGAAICDTGRIRVPEQARHDSQSYVALLALQTGRCLHDALAEGRYIEANVATWRVASAVGADPHQRHDDVYPLC